VRGVFCDYIDAAWGVSSGCSLSDYSTYVLGVISRTLRRPEESLRAMWVCGRMEECIARPGCLRGSVLMVGRIMVHGPRQLAGEEQVWCSRVRGMGRSRPRCERSKGKGVNV